MFWKNKKDESNVEEKVKQLFAEIALLRAENTAIRTALAALETGVYSVRGLVNKKLGKGYEGGVNGGLSEQEMALAREFLGGVPHLAQAEGARLAQEKGLIGSAPSFEDGDN